MKQLVIMFLAVVLVVAAIGCGKKHYVLGDPTLEVQKTNAGKVKMTFMQYLNTNVTMELTFASKMNTTAREDYITLQARSEFGGWYILVQKDLYKDVLAQIELGDTVTVYGRVDAAKLPTDDSPQMAIVIDK